MLCGSSCAIRPTQEVSGNGDAIRALENRVGEQGLRILQQEALIRQLEERVLAQQRSLDDAIQEVVRAKAKQRNLGSRAQAASEMAEAEIALKTFRAKGDGRELAQAEQLLKLASEEFENENFGGALYLTSRAKSRSSPAELRGPQPSSSRPWVL